MTVDEVRERVEAIRRWDGDDERQHGMEDDLYRDVLRAIADGQRLPGGTLPMASQLAEEALKARDIEFARWCA